MDLRFTPAEDAFRDEVRRFLRDHVPRRLSDKVRHDRELTKADHDEWHAILNARGWLASHWPREYGGPGWTVVERAIFEDEAARAPALSAEALGVMEIVHDATIRYLRTRQQFGVPIGRAA